MNGKGYDLSDSWEFTKLLLVYNNFINRNRNSEHYRRQNSSAWIDVGKKGHSTNLAALSQKILCETVMHTW